MSSAVLAQAAKLKSANSGEAGLRRPLTVALLAAVTYYLTAEIGFVFALQPGPVSTLWMPNSILLAALLLTPKRSWWIVLVAVFPAHFVSELRSGVPILISLALFISNSAQALIGAFGICYFVKDQLRFDRFRDLVVFVFFGAFLAPFLSSFLDVGTWRYSAYWEIWRIRFFSNVLAAITLIPVIVTWAEADIKAALKAPLRRWVEVAILTAGLLAVGIAVFSSDQVSADKPTWLLYCPLVFLLWAAVRFGPLGASTSVLVVMFMAIFGATHGQGPFIENSSAYNALSIQGFLIVVALPLLALAGVIEERRRAEASSRQNEERLAMALTSARMGTWEWDIQGNTAKWSDETKRIFGLSPDDPETTSEDFIQMIHPNDRSLVNQAINRSISEGAPYEAEFRISQPDGSVRWVRGRGKVLSDEAGKPLRMIGLNADITESKNAEEALRQSEARLARTEDFSLVMLTHVGLDGSWLKVPQTLCDLLGYTEQELLARTFKDVTHPDDFEADWNQCQRLIRGEAKSFDIEKRYIQRDGHTIWVHQNCSVVEDDNGQPIHFITYISDITDRKFAEQALLESNERNQAILRALPDMMFLQTREGNYLDYYARDHSSLLIPGDAFLGKNVRDVLPPELAARVMECVGRLTRKDETQVLEYSLQIGDEHRHYEARLVLAEGDKVLSIIRDVTDARRAADSLRESEEKLLRSNQQIRALAASLMSAQDSERTRIAHLLHDDVSQNIAAFGVAISRLKRKLASGNPEIVKELEALGQHTNDVTTQIRRLSHQLQPEVLESLGLVATLESAAADFRHEEQITVKINADIRRNIPLDVSVCVYRVALEALRNVSRHSGANLVNITLREEDVFLTLEISDSGRGFDVEKAKRESGIGLASAEERVKLLQGTFEIRSKPEAGTTLIARVPLAR
ncbi:MAG: PAS domain S-box protein [Acidobacteriota bacterium]